MNEEIYNDMIKNNILGYEENSRLAIMAKGGSKEALDKLISHNYKLILKLAKKYKSDIYSEEDLFQDGIIGMIRALENYDETKSSFTTHAFNWIRAEMLANITKNTTDFHYDFSFYYKLKKYKKLASDNEKDELSDDELAENNLTRKDVDIINKYGHKECYSLESLSECIEASIDNNDRTLRSDVSVENIVINNELKKHLNEEIENRLKPLEKYIILNNFGINCHKKKLSELANELKVSRQYVSKIKLNAMGKLRKSRYLRDFFSYIE